MARAARPSKADSPPRGRDSRRGEPASFDRETGEVRGSGSGAGAGGNPGEDYDQDQAG